MADAAEGFSTLFNRAGLFLRAAGDWLMASDQPSFYYGDARVGGEGSLADGRRDRQSERQNDRKWRDAGYNTGKKIKGRNRHIVVDTLGLMVGLVVHSADIQDRDGAAAVLETILKRRPWLRHIFTDGCSAGPKLRGVLCKVTAFTVTSVPVLQRDDSRTVSFYVCA